MFNYAKHEGKELLKENETIKTDPQFQPSDAERKKFHKLLDNELRKNKMRSLIQMSKKIFTKIAVVVFVLILGFTLLFTTVKAFRNKVLEFILDFQDEYVSVKLGEKDNSNESGGITLDWHDYYIPSYIPDGYYIYDMSDMGETKIISYRNNENKEIDFYELESATTANIDTENADIIKSIKINGEAGIFVLKGEKTTVSWTNNEKIFVIGAKLDEKEIMKIAESVVYVE